MTTQQVARAVYSLCIFDCAGERERYEAADFAGLLRHCHDVAVRRALGTIDGTVRCYNLDNCDVGDDGLTEEESDAVDDALAFEALFSVVDRGDRARLECGDHVAIRGPRHWEIYRIVDGVEMFVRYANDEQRAAFVAAVRSSVGTAIPTLAVSP